MIDQIGTTFPEVAETPDRTNKSTFSTLMKAAFQNMGDFLGSMRLFKTEFNTSVEQINSVAAGLSQQTPVDTYSFAESYDFPDCVAFPDGNTYRAIDASAYPASYLPISVTNLQSTATSNSFASKVITTTSHANKTYTFKINGANRWTPVGYWTLRIYDGLFGSIATTTMTHNQSFGINSATGTFGATPSPNILLVIDRNGGSGYDDYQLYSAWLSESSDPNTNLLTGNSTWETDFSGWGEENMTIDQGSPVTSHWKNISASPIDDSAGNGNTQKCWSADKVYDQFATRDTTIAGKGAINGQTWTGAQNFTGATVTVATASTGDNDTSPASTAFVQQEIKAQSCGCAFMFSSPESGDEAYIRFPFAATITRVDAGVSAATSCSFNLSEASTYGSSGTDVMSSSLVADTDGANTTSFSNASIAAGAWLRCYVTSVSGTPAFLDVSVTFNRA